MEFTSYSYLVFLLFSVVLVRQLAGTRREWALLGLSVAFYASWNPFLLLVLLGIGWFTYAVGPWVARQRGQFGRLMLPIAAILLVLGVFKYTGMVVEGLNWLIPAAARLEPPAIILPLGISFFTFECISYLLDVYKGTPQLTPLRRFLLFPSFWPHLIAGPILRIKEFAPQLDAPRNPSGAESLQAIDRIVFGFLKKLVLANSLAPTVDQVFTGASTNSALDNWVGAIAFGLQIYFDFSAYSDIAIGSANLVGIRFPENFDGPYHAKSPSEFWTRWHMTLSRWIRDYLFFPLNLRAGRRLWLRYVYLVLVMAAVGLWHGAAITFVLWGVWHGLLMVGHRMAEKRLPIATPAWVRSFGGWIVTFTLVQAGWILFRATSLEQAFEMLSSMARLRGLTPALGVNDYMLLAFCLVFYFLLEPRLRAMLTRDVEGVPRYSIGFWARPLVYGCAAQLVFMFDRANVAFIYFQF